MCSTVLPGGSLFNEKEHLSFYKYMNDKYILIHVYIYAAAAAATKLFQSCLTLCDRIDSSPPRSPSLGFSRQEHWSGLPFPSPMHDSEK